MLRKKNSKLATKRLVGAHLRALHNEQRAFAVEARPLDRGAVKLVHRDVRRATQDIDNVRVQPLKRCKVGAFANRRIHLLGRFKDTKSEVRTFVKCAEKNRQA